MGEKEILLICYGCDNIQQVIESIDITECPVCGCEDFVFSDKLED